MQLLEVSQGLHAEIRVVEWPRWRKLIGAGTPYGASYLEPSAKDIYYDSPDGPGPVIQFECQLAWLMAGCLKPKGRGLMLGLGCGSGAVGLLHCFPNTTLDVVEIDPVMVNVARRHFPLVDRNIRERRLRIIVQDVIEFLKSNSHSYDYVLADLFIGSEMPKEMLEGELLVKIASVTNHLWINTIGSLDEAPLHHLLDTLDRVNLPAQWLCSPTPLKAWIPTHRNWVISTASLDTRLQQFVPFRDLNGSSVKEARENYQNILNNILTREEARSNSNRQGFT